MDTKIKVGTQTNTLVEDYLQIRDANDSSRFGFPFPAPPGSTSGADAQQRKNVKNQYNYVVHRQSESSPHLPLLAARKGMEEAGTAVLDGGTTTTGDNEDPKKKRPSFQTYQKTAFKNSSSPSIYSKSNATKSGRKMRRQEKDTEPDNLHDLEEDVLKPNQLDFELKEQEDGGAAGREEDKNRTPEGLADDFFHKSSTRLASTMRLPTSGKNSSKNSRSPQSAKSENIKSGAGSGSAPAQRSPLILAKSAAAENNRDSDKKSSPGTSAELHDKKNTASSMELHRVENPMFVVPHQESDNNMAKREETKSKTTSSEDESNYQETDSIHGRSGAGEEDPGGIVATNVNLAIPSLEAELFPTSSDDYYNQEFDEFRGGRNWTTSMGTRGWNNNSDQESVVESLVLSSPASDQDLQELQDELDLLNELAEEQGQQDHMETTTDRNEDQDRNTESEQHSPVGSKEKAQGQMVVHTYENSIEQMMLNRQKDVDQIHQFTSGDLGREMNNPNDPRLSEEQPSSATSSKAKSAATTYGGATAGTASRANALSDLGTARDSQATLLSDEDLKRQTPLLLPEGLLDNVGGGVPQGDKDKNPAGEHQDGLHGSCTTSMIDENSVKNDVDELQNSPSRRERRYLLDPLSVSSHQTSYDIAMKNRPVLSHSSSKARRSSGGSSWTGTQRRLDALRQQQQDELQNSTLVVQTMYRDEEDGQHSDATDSPLSTPSIRMGSFSRSNLDQSLLHSAHGSSGGLIAAAKNSALMKSALRSGVHSPPVVVDPSTIFAASSNSAYRQQLLRSARSMPVERVRSHPGFSSIEPHNSRIGIPPFLNNVATTGNTGGSGALDFSKMNKRGTSGSNRYFADHLRNKSGPHQKRLPNRYLVLQDVTHNMLLPCVCDIKIGQQTYDPLASASKRKKCIEKYPLQEKLGFRLVGMKYTKVMRLHFKNEDPGTVQQCKEVASADREKTTSSPEASTAAVEDITSSSANDGVETGQGKGTAEEEGPSHKHDLSNRLEKIFRVSKRDSKWGLRLNEKTVLHGLELFFKYIEAVSLKKGVVVQDQDQHGLHAAGVMLNGEKPVAQEVVHHDVHIPDETDEKLQLELRSKMLQKFLMLLEEIYEILESPTSGEVISKDVSGEESEVVSATSAAGGTTTGATVTSDKKHDAHQQEQHQQDEEVGAGATSCVAHELRDATQVICEKNRPSSLLPPRWKLFSSSLLLVYDMADPVNTFWVYLIDFAHAFQIDMSKFELDEDSEVDNCAEEGATATRESDKTKTEDVVAEKRTATETKPASKDEASCKTSKDKKCSKNAEKDDGYLYGLQNLIHYVKQMQQRVQNKNFGKTESSSVGGNSDEFLVNSPPDNLSSGAAGVGA
ncbi:unnamed protein product [Amoebophrya sp. A120]|nr:unnamed protein product [Amoebophrya sp. A120]|eukprot:GSA120T00009284001.1